MLFPQFRHYTALWHATRGGHLEVVKVLLEAGADTSMMPGRYWLEPQTLAELAASEDVKAALQVGR